MSRLPIAIGATAFASVMVGCLAFALDSGAIAHSSALMIVTGMLGIALAGLAGLILARAPWARWVLTTLVIATTVLASIGGSALFWVTLAMGAVAIVGLTGPWLSLWVRREPVADRIGLVPVALISSAMCTPVLVGFAAHSGVGWEHWSLVVTVAVSAWAYGRGLALGIWSFRLLVPALGLLAGIATSNPGGAAILVLALALCAMAWSSEARAVTAVITPPLPRPIPQRGSNDASR